MAAFERSMKKRIYGIFAGLVAAALLSPAAISSAQVPTGDASSFQVMEASIDDIHSAYRAGTLSARQLTQKYLDRIAAYDQKGPNINAIITLNPDALDDADRLDTAYAASGFVGVLHGIPILVKDEIDTIGMPTTMGTLVLNDYRPTPEALVF
jgi:Asp-tRNA(Asn)/Glu-tRNA(Gln) amidotransferase A subunit family amidase